MLPILGSSTLRDTVALPVDWKGDAVTQVEDIATRNTLYGVRAVDQRAALLKAEGVIDEAALDKYSFIRDAYLQRRRNAVYDGDPPEEEQPEDQAPSDQPAK